MKRKFIEALGIGFLIVLMIVFMGPTDATEFDDVNIIRVRLVTVRMVRVDSAPNSPADQLIILRNG